MLWNINLSFERLFSSQGQVAYVLRTRALLSKPIAKLIPFNLHVLCLPLALILSQDQTLHSKRLLILFFSQGFLIF